jgi:signal transduction histidine kinase
MNGMGGTVRMIIVTPFSRRALGELVFCLAAAPLGFTVVALPSALFGTVALLSGGASGRDQPGQPPVGLGALGAMLALLLLAPPLAPLLARGLGAVHRFLAARLLGQRIGAPPPVRPGRIFGWLRDGAGWRAVAYLIVKPPVAIFEGYAVFCWSVGLVDMTYPFWWRLFRNHPPQVHLDPVPVLTPFGSFRVATFPGAFAAFGAGLAMLLAAGWIARAATRLDLALMRGLLGPGRLAQRVRDLEHSRALAVDDSAALLRRVERDLHDGAQVRLAALAMNLGRAREELGEAGDPPDLAHARELVRSAHRNAKDALVELRDLARGIHPPVLDNGLADALASLAAGSAVPVRLDTDIPVRPTPAIETIAYFCAAELLANAAKHSRANRIGVRVLGRGGALVLHVDDDGIGGADPVRGSGLSGLAHRVSTVDGRLDIASPVGGPTRIAVELPLRA